MNYVHDKVLNDISICPYLKKIENVFEIEELGVGRSVETEESTFTGAPKVSYQPSHGLLAFGQWSRFFLTRATRMPRNPRTCVAF